MHLKTSFREDNGSERKERNSKKKKKKNFIDLCFESERQLSYLVFKTKYLVFKTKYQLSCLSLSKHKSMKFFFFKFFFLVSFLTFGTVIFSETNGQVHIPRKQRLIYRKQYQYATSEEMDDYR